MLTNANANFTYLNIQVLATKRIHRTSQPSLCSLTLWVYYYYWSLWCKQSHIWKILFEGEHFLFLLHCGSWSGHVHWESDKFPDVLQTRGKSCFHWDCLGSSSVCWVHSVLVLVGEQLLWWWRGWSTEPCLCRGCAMSDV